jgi:hypothetical protein
MYLDPWRKWAYKTKMTYDQLVRYYGTPIAAAKARRIDRQRVHGWKKRGSIPLTDQVEYEVVTGGRLKADLPRAVRRTSG